MSLPDDFWAKQIGKWGYLGVQVFFVISGTVIPYSMWKNNYELKNIGGFLLRRIVRIDPPYFACILLILILRYITTLTPWYKGAPFGIDFKNLLYHIGYLNAFTGKPWLSVVFWTLAIEFQFYILIALIFSLVSSKNVYIWVSTLIVLNLLSYLINSPNLIFNYLTFFSIGILIFRNKIGLINNINTYSMLLVFYFLIYLKTGKIEEVLAGFIPVFFICFVEIKAELFKSLGNLSYSLYLTHSPIGATIISFLSKFISDQAWPRFGLAMFALVSCISFAYFFYHLIEKPSKEWSKRISY